MLFTSGAFCLPTLEAFAGGGLYVSHSVQQDDSTIELDGCSSGKSGLEPKLVKEACNDLPGRLYFEKGVFKRALKPCKF